MLFYAAEVGEPKKKRIKSDTDRPRFSAASMRNQLDQAANLKGEQVSTSAICRNIS
jgi:SAGA-associated factor 29